MVLIARSLFIALVALSPFMALIAPAGSASAEQAAGKPSFIAETFAFAENDTLKAFTFFEVPVRDLFFAPRDDGALEAVVDVTVLIFQDGFQTAGDTWRHRIRSPSLLKARNSTGALRKTVRFPISEGRHVVEVAVSQPEAGTENRLSLKLEAAPTHPKKLAASDILFAVCPSEEDGPGDLREDPLLGRRFGNPLPPVCAHVQVYHPSPAPSEVLTVDWSLETESQGPIRTGSEEIAVGASPTEVVVPLPLDNLWMGRYGLRLTLRLGGWEKVLTTTFEMDETRISLGSDFETTVEMIQIFAGHDEAETLRQLPAAEREAGWEAFWKERDPTPDTERNEFKDEFYRRIRYANRHFGVLEPGWRSDRGRVYILHGQPDEVESYPQNVNSPPYEIWDYFRLRARFVFVDYEGFGRFVLYQPGRR
jgi:GWxTD domain-containing protein